MNSINMEGMEGLQDVGTEFDGMMMLEDAMPMEQFTNWDEVTNDFNKPFQFDNIGLLGVGGSVDATLARARGMIPKFTKHYSQ
ncbi:hypothetical protein CH063_14559 [Colletotrichum higginsianum]|uniref:Uncharacterized protein n=1 Tax=Colletotrichum higginsianum (strain IMI 349063) TaxID=759273 RepID=H1VZ36_COLHI|nr:hypothetical protein CH063_14559 [Colletotrichum higginsianum]